MAARDDAFTRRLVTKLGRAAIKKARPGIPSRALRKALNLFVLNNLIARMQIPHYWAIYVHDGRGPFSAGSRGGPAQFLVWFRNPREDPRLVPSGVTPVRARNRRRLTREQFLRGLEANAEAKELGLPPPMIITRRVTSPSFARKFFDNRIGMRGFVEQANVEPVLEMVEMIAVFRSYESDQKAIQVQDTTLDRAVNDVGVVR